MEGKGRTGERGRVGASREREENEKGRRKDRGREGSPDGVESLGQEKPRVAKDLIAGEQISIALDLPSLDI